MSAPETQPVTDPIPPSEPAVPSLPGPDTGVYHHVPAAAHHGPAPLPVPETPAEEPR